MIPVINHQDLAESRLASQFKESVKLIAYLRALVNGSDDLELAAQQVLNLRSINTAQGVQLDILGELVGQDRFGIGVSQEYFGFDGVIGILGFGTTEDPTVGGRYRGLDEPTTGSRDLTDPEMRSLIRARTLKNRTRSTVEDIIESVIFTFDASAVIIHEGDAAYTLTIAADLTATDISLIQNTSIIPKTLGVKVENIIVTRAEFFGYGIPSSAGFGDLDDPEVGGYFGSIL